jgi:hypothetical protein
MEECARSGSNDRSTPSALRASASNIELKALLQVPALTNFSARRRFSSIRAGLAWYGDGSDRKVGRD